LDTILSQISPVDCLTAKKVKIIYPEVEGGLFLQKKVVVLERGPLSLVSTIEELLGRKSSGSGLEIR
jgi:hypothetical protein